MGRKIPAKKHRGVKDPLQQQARRLQSIKTKINAPPKDPDEQPAPRSLERLFAFQNKQSNLKRDNPHKSKLNKNKHKILDKDSNKRHNPVSQLRQISGESGREFSLRINSAIRALHSDVVDQQYPQDIEEEDTKGARMLDLRERRARKLRRAGAAGRRDRADQTPTNTLTRGQNLTLRKKARKEKADEDRELVQAEVRYERVQFGEQADAPPTLSAPRHAAPRAARPAARAMLLTALLNPHAAPAPAAALHREKARLDAVAAYRALKAAKRKESNKRNK